MKLSTVFLIGSGLLFAAALADADTHDHRRAMKGEKHQRHDEHRREHRHERHQEHRQNHRDERRHERRHDRRERVVHRHRRHHRDAFVGGLVLGGIAAHAFTHSDYCPTHGKRHRRRDVSFSANRYGECFRVEHRRHRDVYVEVPRHRCF